MTNTWHTVGWVAIAFAILLVVVGPSSASASEAGTRITNVASVRYAAGGAGQVGESNTVALIVAERLDLALVRSGAEPVARGAGVAIPIVLTNTGNGTEGFVVQVAGASAGTIVAIDRDRDGHYDPATDTGLADGRTPDLAPGATLALVVVADTGTVAAGGRLVISAAAVTGAGTPGTLVAGRGDGGGDAVVGATGAMASLAVPVDTAAAPTLVKTQTIVAPDGGSSPVSGAIVTYVLDAGFVAAVDDARIDDPVPAGTRYVAGSLRLDGAALADPGDVTAIHVALGPVPGPATHRIQFQVQIP